MPAGASPEGWAALARPGAVALMRHALAPGTGDPAGFRLDDCATQRNLDDRGRAQARAVGEAIGAAGIGFDAVLTSQWCRCRETAELLALGAVRPFPALNSFFADRSTRDAQTAAVLDFLAVEGAGQRILLVTHQVNITALTGRVPRSGEIIVAERGEDGRLRVTGTIRPGE
ncbi:histidine phosphatase family protein [Limibaculum sp. M0105]|uniref:Histidine phosphatase family protein n=2 Tax=Thermohalobaculum xanthum TaxID=2753746 RepID=A0A8J7M6R9_9RHOB|nr:histidine phosphatase family protein [Thermohalobaculum xanthum]